MLFFLILGMKYDFDDIRSCTFRTIVEYFYTQIRIFLSGKCLAVFINALIKLSFTFQS